MIFLPSGFTCASVFLRLHSNPTVDMELLPVAPLVNHPQAHDLPVYFASVIIHKDNV